MLTAIAIILDGLTYASWLFMVSVGLTLVYGVMKILNIAHGSLYAVGAYAGASLVGFYFSLGYAPVLSYLLLVVAALAVGLLCGYAIEQGVLRFMYGRDEVLMVLATYAIFLVLEDAVKIIWGVDPYFAYQPYTMLGLVEVYGLPYSLYDFMLMGLAVVVGVLVWWGIKHTQMGRLLIAVIHDREMSLAMGINVKKVFTVTFIIGAVLAALSGAFTAPKISVTPGIGVEVIVLAFAVAVIGGLGSIGGSMIGALLVGLARAAAVHLLPEAELFVIYAVMALVLAVRPQGLFAPAEARKI